MRVHARRFARKHAITMQQGRGRKLRGGFDSNDSGHGRILPRSTAILNALPRETVKYAMPSLTLEHHNRAELAAMLADDTWIVACLCAAWCDTCTAYRASFDALADRHPDKCFVWIDIEDQADIVGDFDVENFPTLLIQRGDTVAFFGTVLPDLQLADRLLRSQAEKSPAELQAGMQHPAWQRDGSLRARVRAAAQSR